MWELLNTNFELKSKTISFCIDPWPWVSAAVGVGVNATCQSAFGGYNIEIRNTGISYTLCVFFSFFRSGEYSASAIKSASVSWNTLIGCPGYLRWANITTILTLLWIIKFVLAGNGAIRCNRGRNKVNNRPATSQEPVATATPKLPTAAITATVSSMRPIRTAQSTATVSRRVGTQLQTAARRQCRRSGLDFDHNSSSSISGTKVAEDKTWGAAAAAAASRQLANQEPEQQQREQSECQRFGWMRVCLDFEVHLWFS